MWLYFVDSHCTFNFPSLWLLLFKPMTDLLCVLATAVKCLADPLQIKTD